MGQPVVNKVQVNLLANVIKVLQDHVLDDSKKHYYIVIDRLDENWVDDELRYRLIKSLLQTSKEFNQKISNVKIIISIREDLLDRVFRFTREPGFQEEKYNSLKLTLRWTSKELEELLDKRVNRLIRGKYTGSEVKLKDILPRQINISGRKSSPTNYLIERTLLCPRDAIAFVNECLNIAEGATQISHEHIVQVEETYSRNRLRALADEWSADYKLIFESVYLLKKQPERFRVNDLFNLEGFEDRLLEFIVNNTNNKDDIYEKIYTLYYDRSQPLEAVIELVKIFYRIGVLGLKQETFTTIAWSFQGHRTLDIDASCVCHVHPAFWRVLEIAPGKS